MDIQDILLQQKDLLLQLRDVVGEEKKALISEDGKKLHTLVENKAKLMDLIEETEKSRLSNFGDCKLSEMDIPNDQMQTVQQMGQEIRKIYEEVRDYQEINLMLTQQSIDYQTMLMNVIQSAIHKAGTYGKDAKIDGKQNFRASVDRSV